MHIKLRNGLSHIVWCFVQHKYNHLDGHDNILYSVGHWLAKVSAAPTELNLLLSVFPQGFISGFTLISPWAMRGCRPYRALCRIGCVSPGFHIGLCPHFTLGYAGVPPFQGSLHSFICVSPGFHIGLRPHFTLGFAGVSPFQGSLSDCLLFPQGFISGFALISPWAMQEYRPFRALCRIGRLRCCVVVLCSLNVFGCVNGLLRSCFCIWLYCLWDWLVRSGHEPQGGDTPAKPRAQALGSVCYNIFWAPLGAILQCEY